VQALVPHLAVYLGHVSPRETCWHLSVSPELLNAAAQGAFSAEKSQPQYHGHCAPEKGKICFCVLLLLYILLCVLVCFYPNNSDPS
jgi:hypothetical protein